MGKGSIEWEYNQEEGLVLRIKPGLDKLFNGEVCKQALAVRKEMLSAFRDILDIAIKHMGEKEARTSPRRTKINID